MNITHMTVIQNHPMKLSLNSNDVHLWTASIDDFCSDLDRYEDMLSPDERARSLRFVFDSQRHGYIIRRGLLRQVLGYYTSRLPHELIFSYNACGKPSLADGPTFNLAHSTTELVYAITAIQPIGVDLERINPIKDLLHLAQKCLSAWELRHFMELPTKVQTQAFYTYWTSKESVLKATGFGLSIPPKSVEIYLNCDQGPCVWRFNDFGILPNSWWLSSYEIDDSYRISVASLITKTGLP